MSGGGEGGKILGGGGGGGRSSSPVCSFVSVTGKSTLLGSCMVTVLEGLDKSDWNVLSVVDEIGLPVEGVEEEVPPNMLVEEDGAMRDGGKGNPDELLPEEPIDGLRDE